MKTRRLLRMVVLSSVVAAIFMGATSLASPGHSGDSKPGLGCGDRNHTHYRQDECESHGHH